MLIKLLTKDTSTHMPPYSQHPSPPSRPKHMSIVRTLRNGSSEV